MIVYKGLWTSDGNFDAMIISAALSIISLSFSAVQKVLAEKNNFVSWAGIVFVFIFATASVLVRLFAVLLYLAPSLGLANLLNHWKLGKLGVGELEDHSHVEEDKKINFSEGWKQSPNFTDYTLFSLTFYYIIFLGVIISHFILVFLIKMKFAQGFRSKQNLKEKFFHLSTQMFIPTNYKDWDSEDLEGNYHFFVMC